MSKFPALKFGLSQIPKNFLKDNLLPKLKDPNSKLIFNGAVVKDEGY